MCGCPRSVPPRSRAPLSLSLCHAFLSRVDAAGCTESRQQQQQQYSQMHVGEVYISLSTVGVLGPLCVNECEDGLKRERARGARDGRREGGTATHYCDGERLGRRSTSSTSSPWSGRLHRSQSSIRKWQLTASWSFVRPSSVLVTAVRCMALTPPWNVAAGSEHAILIAESLTRLLLGQYN